MNVTQIMSSRCVSSDSGKTVSRCWCAECREVRQDVRTYRKQQKVRKEQEIIEIVEVSDTQWIVVTRTVGGAS